MCHLDERSGDTKEYWRNFPFFSFIDFIPFLFFYFWNMGNMEEIGTLRITSTPHQIRLGRLSRPVTPGRRGGEGNNPKQIFVLPIYMFSLYLVIRGLILSLRKREGYRTHTLKTGNFMHTPTIQLFSLKNGNGNCPPQHETCCLSTLSKTIYSFRLLVVSFTVSPYDKL